MKLLRLISGILLVLIVFLFVGCERQHVEGETVMSSNNPGEEECLHPETKESLGEGAEIKELWSKNFEELYEKGEDAITLLLSAEMGSISPWLDVNDVNRRLTSALAQWRNGIVDSEPNIFYATLAVNYGGGHNLRVCMFDENSDLVGFGIREEHIGKNGRSVLRDEEYPVFYHRNVYQFLAFGGIPVRARTDKQAIDLAAWEHYVAADKDDVIEWEADWKENLPPIWISRPDPNSIDVYAYAIDRAGNKSSPTKLAYLDGSLIKKLRETGKLK